MKSRIRSWKMDGLILQGIFSQRKRENTCLTLQVEKFIPQSIKDGPKTNLTTRKQFMKPNDSQNNGGIAQSEDTPSESGSNMPVNKTKDKLRNELIIHDLETGHLERHQE